MQSWCQGIGLAAEVKRVFTCSRNVAATLEMRRIWRRQHVCMPVSVTAGDRSWSAGECADPGFEAGFDVEGTDLAAQLGVPDARACLDYCLADSRCNSAVFSKRSTEATGGCYLKAQLHTTKVPGKSRWTVVWCNPQSAPAQSSPAQSAISPKVGVAQTFFYQELGSILAAC